MAPSLPRDTMVAAASQLSLCCFSQTRAEQSPRLKTKEAHGVEEVPGAEQTAEQRTLPRRWAVVARAYGSSGGGRQRGHGPGGSGEAMREGGRRKWRWLRRPSVAVHRRLVKGTPAMAGW